MKMSVLKHLRTQRDLESSTLNANRADRVNDRFPEGMRRSLSHTQSVIDAQYLQTGKTIRSDRHSLALFGSLLGSVYV